MKNHTTKAERREYKKRKRMRVTGKHVFKIKQLMQATPKKKTRS